MRTFQWLKALTNEELLELKLQLWAVLDDLADAESHGRGCGVDERFVRELHACCIVEVRRRFAAGEGHGHTDRP